MKHAIMILALFVATAAMAYDEKPLIYVPDSGMSMYAPDQDTIVDHVEWVTVKDLPIEEQGVWLNMISQVAPNEELIERAKAAGMIFPPAENGTPKLTNVGGSPGVGVDVADPQAWTHLKKNWGWYVVGGVATVYADSEDWWRHGGSSDLDVGVADTTQGGESQQGDNSSTTQDNSGNSGSIVNNFYSTQVPAEEPG